MLYVVMIMIYKEGHVGKVYASDLLLRHFRPERTPLGQRTKSHNLARPSSQWESCTCPQSWPGWRRAQKHGRRGPVAGDRGGHDRRREPVTRLRKLATPMPAPRAGAWEQLRREGVQHAVHDVLREGLDATEREPRRGTPDGPRAANRKRNTAETSVDAASVPRRSSSGDSTSTAYAASREP